MTVFFLTVTMSQRVLVHCPWRNKADIRMMEASRVEGLHTAAAVLVVPRLRLLH